MPKLGPHLFQLLHKQGIKHSFGIPGDFALTLYDALTQSPIKPIITTQEASAGFAADVYARVKGMGLAVVTYSVGGLNVVNAVAGAYAEKSPLVVVSGGPGIKERMERDLLHHQVKGFDTPKRVFEEICVYSTILDNPFTADFEIHKALDYCKTFKRPVYIEVPRDMVYAEIEESSHAPLPIKRTDRGAMLEALHEIRQLFHQAKHPLLMVDIEVQRFGLQQQVLDFVENTGIRVCSTFLGKSIFPENHPQYIGTYQGQASLPHVRDWVEKSDCLVMLGVILSDINLGLFTAHLNKTHTVLVTSEKISVKHHDYFNIEFTKFVTAFCQMDDLRIKKIPEDRRRGGSRLSKSDGKITTTGLLYELNQFLDPQTMLVTDVGDAMFSAIDVESKGQGNLISPGFYASMGMGVPGGIGAALSSPEKRVIVLTGDGAFQMTGWELITAKRLGIHLIVIVMNNGSFTSLRAMGHQNSAFVKIPSLDYVAIAHVLGGHGFLVTTADEMRQSLEKAKAMKVFTILDVRLPPEDVSPALQTFGNLFAETLKG